MGTTSEANLVSKPTHARPNRMLDDFEGIVSLDQLSTRVFRDECYYDGLTWVRPISPKIRDLLRYDLLMQYQRWSAYESRFVES